MKDDGEEYLIMYPRLRKWINECVKCHSKGYKPEMLEAIYPYPSSVTENLRFYFKPLKINDDGLCEACSKTLDSLIIASREI